MLERLPNRVRWPERSNPMRKTTHLALALTSLLAPSLALATENHGDFTGPDVHFLQVSETTQTVGDPEPIWGAPILAGAGDQLAFFPTAFTSLCTPGTSDTTSSVLTTTIQAQGTGTIDNLALAESGDAVLTAFPPFGTPATNASAALTGTVTVVETTAGPIAPVVIPFSGTFTPSASFALPGNFGTSLWNGTIGINVAGVVPNATRVELALDNTLTSNCAAGNTSAKIQKKTVSGPSVAITVNPIECDLEINKTCCVTQPVLPDLGQCEGDMVSMTMEFTGDKCSASNNDQGYSFKCHGKRKVEAPASIDFHDPSNVATPASDIEIGEEVVFTNSGGTLGDYTRFHVDGPWGYGQSLRINTSCEKAFQCGDQFGAFEVTGFESTLGGVVDCNAPPPPPVCAGIGDPIGSPCDAKLVDMVLEYNGRTCQSPLPNPQNGEASCSGDSTGASNVSVVYTGMFSYKQKLSPASNINDGDRIRVTSTWKGGLFPNQEYRITDSSGVLQTVGFHVSCSQPLALGDQFGPFKLVEFTTKNGTHKELGTGGDGRLEACEVPLAPPKPHCTSDLSEITLVYIGNLLDLGCSVSNNQSGYASCSGVADPGDPVSIVLGSGLASDTTGPIEFGDLVTITPASGSTLPTFTSLDVTGAGGSQDISFKTSCHKPLSLGDRFGSFVVYGMDRTEDGPITLGGNVQYQYTVTNPNALPVDNVTVNDSELGTVASGVTLAPGASQTFIATGTLLGTTTNVATVDGDILGDLCTQAEDEVTTTVIVPPSGAFTCSCGQSLTELTLKWDGAQTVAVKVWDGPVGSTLLNDWATVPPGSKRTASGFTAEDATYEIFDSTGTTKLGESKFKLTCQDHQMNGVEDCGKAQGNGKYDDPGLINTWILDGMVDDNETLSCTPTVVGPPPMCGFGPEALVAVAALTWLNRRRFRRE
jgi:hypothetical protein